MAYIRFGLSLLISHLLTVTSVPHQPPSIAFNNYPLPWAHYPSWVQIHWVPVSWVPRPWLPVPLPKPKPFVEETCARTGGQCVRVGECPSGNEHPKLGLCPLQPGFECCYGVSTAETNCRLRGGECFAEGACRPSLIDTLGTCPVNQACCILTARIGISINKDQGNA